MESPKVLSQLNDFATKIENYYDEEETKLTPKQLEIVREILDHEGIKPTQIKDKLVNDIFSYCKELMQFILDKISHNLRRLVLSIKLIFAGNVSYEKIHSKFKLLYENIIDIGLRTKRQIGNALITVLKKVSLFLMQHFRKFAALSIGTVVGALLYACNSPSTNILDAAIKHYNNLVESLGSVLPIFGASITVIKVKPTGVDSMKSRTNQILQTICRFKTPKKIGTPNFDHMLAILNHGALVVSDSVLTRWMSHGWKKALDETPRPSTHFLLVTADSSNAEKALSNALETITKAFKQATDDSSVIRIQCDDPTIKDQKDCFRISMHQKGNPGLLIQENVHLANDEKNFRNAFNDFIYYTQTLNQPIKISCSKGEITEVNANQVIVLSTAIVPQEWLKNVLDTFEKYELDKSNIKEQGDDMMTELSGLYNKMFPLRENWQPETNGALLAFKNRIGQQIAVIPTEIYGEESTS